jgi:hypothetical protein
VSDADDRRRRAIEETARELRKDAARGGRQMTHEEARDRVVRAQQNRDKGA